MASGLLKSFKTSGAIAFSSPRLVNRIIRNIDFEQASCIIELGPGNGRITTDILQRMKMNCTLYAFEINTEFVEELDQINDPRLKVFNESAEHINEFITHQHSQGTTYIVSSIPFGILPEDECDRIMQAIDEFSDKDTYFIQYSYSIIQYRRFKKYFPKIKVQFELINIPPAFIFVCRK